MTTSHTGNNPGLFKEVFSVVKKIPKGKVMTYGQIARILGTRDVRKIGWALHSNKNSEEVPCHRVVNKDGRLAPAYAFGGPMEQKAKLLGEDVKFVDDTHVNLIDCLYEAGDSDSL